MADSKRLDVLKALCTLLAGVTPANGYQHDLSQAGRVVRGVPVLSANDPLPCVSVLEFPKLDTDVQYTGGQKKQSFEWDLVIQGWTATPATITANPTDSTYLLMADVQKRLALVMDDGGNSNPGPNYLLGRRIAGLQMAPGMVRPADEASSTPCFYLRVRIKVAEKVSDPYDLS